MNRKLNNELNMILKYDENQILSNYSQNYSLNYILGQTEKKIFFK